MPFTCSICEEESTRICVSCTKDSCENHLCEKCSRCSDCCSCEVRLDDDERKLPAWLEPRTARRAKQVEELPDADPPPQYYAEPAEPAEVS